MKIKSATFLLVLVVLLVVAIMPPPAAHAETNITPADQVERIIDAIRGRLTRSAKSWCVRFGRCSKP